MKTSIIRIIACAVFKPALEHFRLEEAYPHVQFTYLPAKLHLRPQELKDFLLKEIISARESNEQVICLYGECFPDITNVCAQHGVIKIPGHYCYEMLLGTEQFNQLIEETVGTYFLERELLINFEEYCAEPLELQDEEMRRFCFERYKRLLYIRQPQDQDLAATASDLAKFLQLSLEIKDADYSYLENKLIEVISFKKTGNHNNEKA